MPMDARDKQLDIDDYVRYVDTGTIGQIVDIKTEDNIDWILIDKTNLWYRANLVELLDEKDIKEKFTPSRDDDGVDIDTIKEQALDLQDIELDSNVAEGGG